MRAEFKVVGIDPGLKGAICFLDRELNLEAHLMPVINDFLHIESFARIIEHNRDCILKVYLEKGQAMPGQGVSSMFKYGKQCGMLEGVLAALKIPYALTRPQEWQSVHIAQNYSITPKERSYLTFKQIFNEKQSLPTKRSKKPHMGVVDAALIALFGAVDSQLIVSVGSQIQ